WFETRMKRASRIGPFAVMNEGTEFAAPSRVASVTWGFALGDCGLARPGLLPPVEGWAWHCAQLLPLKVGPRPFPSSPGTVPETESISINSDMAWVKRFSSS